MDFSIITYIVQFVSACNPRPLWGITVWFNRKDIRIKTTERRDYGILVSKRGQ